MFVCTTDKVERKKGGWRISGVQICVTTTVDTWVAWVDGIMRQTDRLETGIRATEQKWE